jgi:hypothetical protein
VTTHLNRALIVLHVLAASSCAPRQPAASPSFSWTTWMPTTRDVTPALARAAEKAGCIIKSEKPHGFYATCGTWLLSCTQAGGLVRRTCTDTTESQCVDMWHAVLDKVTVEKPEPKATTDDSL